MKRIFQGVGFGLSAIIFSLGFGVLSAHAATINVPGDEATIQAAVTAASAGDTVTVDAGTYAENVTIPAGKNGLILSGHSSADTVIQVANGTTGITVGSASVHISGFHITATGPDYGAGDANRGII